MILADRFLNNSDGTAWLVLRPTEDWVEGWQTLDRPCDGCDGEKFWFDVDGEEWNCSDCGATGRHTFEITILCEHCRDTVANPVKWADHDKTYRVSIVGGMVLPIVDRKMQPVTPDGPVILLGHNGPSYWSESTGHREVTLPSAAAPGRWAVLLQVAS